VYERGEVRWGDLRGRDYLADLGIGGRMIKWIFSKWDGAWSGLVWLWIGTGGWLLRNLVMNIRVP
jgi:hypothetical protein